MVLRRIAIAGLGFAPTLVWLDDHDELAELRGLARSKPLV
jgi:hypothetical protein